MLNDAECPLIGDRFRDSFRAIVRNVVDNDPPVDEAAVRAAVSAYARSIGCTESNVTAACNYGLTVGHYTLACIRDGKSRATQLRLRQPAAPDAA